MKLAFKKPLARDDKQAAKAPAKRLKAKKTAAGQGRASILLKVVAAVMVTLATVGGALMVVVSFQELGRVDAAEKKRLAEAARQQVMSQQMAKFALEAASGTEEAFTNLEFLKDEFTDSIGTLSAVDPATNKPLSPRYAASELATVQRLWNGDEDGLRKLSDRIVPNQEILVGVANTAIEIDDLVPQLLAQVDELLGILVDVEAPSEQIRTASNLLFLAQRIQISVDRVVGGGAGSATAADRFGRDALQFEKTLEGLLQGSDQMGIEPIEDGEALDKLQEIAEVFGGVNTKVEFLLSRLPELFDVQTAAEQFTTQSDQILKASSALEDAYNADNPDRRDAFALAYIGAALLLAVMLVGLIIYVVRTRQATVKSEQEAARLQQSSRENQEAIMSLLDEIDGLASRDLTVQATVTEQFTGHIADAFNTVVESMREIIVKINRTSAEVASSAASTQATARQLAEASDHQARQIVAAGESVNAMASQITGVSHSAQQSAEVARHSVEIAHKGAEAVRSTIAGMDQIRDHIQETSKRIKRLGESSQEIGDIVELINDIADQTNILALNASIQAASAGEAGRGFAVVADEVQRLAERSGNATKQIEALVKTIQNDTNEAVSSMEESTTGVVGGAQLAENAGESLTEIESVSNELAVLIDGISKDARGQAETAISVSSTMDEIQQITRQTSAGTSQTAVAIGHLAAQVEELRESVAGFKLPAEDMAQLSSGQ